MKKQCMCFVLAFTLMLSGCGNLNSFFYPNIGKGELFYDRVTEITKTDVDNGKYNDIFINDTIVKNMTQAQVFVVDNREKSGESLNYIDLIPFCKEENRLGEWIRSSVCSYGFSGADRDSNKINYFMIKNFSQKNGYYDYLYVMKALTIKYGECTSEIYRKSDGSIISVISRNSNTTGDDTITTFKEAFDRNEIMVSSRWVKDNYEIKVDFRNQNECTVVYEFKY